jgi:putative endopeptidase
MSHPFRVLPAIVVFIGVLSGRHPELTAAESVFAAAELSTVGQSINGDYQPWGFNYPGAEFRTKPGDDFFRHGNGAWLDRTVIAPDRNVNGVDTVLTDIAEARTRDILERGAEGVDPSARADAARIGTLYASFMDEARAEALEANPIAPLLAGLRAANSRDDLAAIMGAAPQTFFSSIFSISIGIDAKAPDKYSVSIAQGGLGLPNRDYYLTAQFSDKKAAYLDYIKQILGMIGWDKPQESAAAVLAFESDIAAASWTLSESRDSEKTYNPMREADLAIAAPFPWRTYFQAAGLPELDHIVVGEVTAIPKIAALFARTPMDTLKAWLAFRLADSAAPNLSKQFVNAAFDFRGKTLGGIAELPQRWKRGVRLVEDTMGQAIGRVYVARYFPPEAKAKVEDLVTHIRHALQERIGRVAWMSPETKAKAVEKLAQLNVKIAYPNKWRDYSGLEFSPGDLIGNVQNVMKFEWLRDVNRLNLPVDRDEWGMTPQTVNAYYSSILNEIVLAAAQLQAPFFDPAADPAVNYGGIGTLIGHELIHGFDDDGRKYDGDGVLSNWWTDADALEFTKRSADLGRQYNAFEPFPGAHVDGDLTMGENIADLGGALVALDAYHQSLTGPVPVIDGLTGDQRFFLSFAQSWRDKRTEDGVRQMMVSNPHAPEQYRVNGVVRNMDAWYDAFGVKAGDKLYLSPDLRVRTW